jgi:hypothetical protein
MLDLERERSNHVRFIGEQVKWRAFGARRGSGHVRGPFD